MPFGILITNLIQIKLINIVLIYIRLYLKRCLKNDFFMIIIIQNVFSNLQYISNIKLCIYQFYINDMDSQ
jgi:hypothetical protein